MKLNAKHYLIVTALAIFIGMPLLLYALGDTPRRSILKEVLSILTLLAFSLMLGQFFLARSNKLVLSQFRPAQILKVHKVIAYGAVGIILLHPFLIVLPRYFEAGVKPWDAFVTNITTLDSTGILLGLIAWVLLLVMVLTSIFRIRLIQRLRIKYRGWRYFHGVIAVAFVVLAIWHAVDLGRHTETAMATLYISVAFLGVALLARYHWSGVSKKHAPAINSDGAQR